MQIKFIIPVPSYTSVKAISAEKSQHDDKSHAELCLYGFVTETQF